MALTKRFSDLLEAAAGALEDGRDPFSLDFLGKHEVTADECRDLSNMLAVIIFGFLAAPEWVQNAVLITGAMFSNGDYRMAKEIWPILQGDEAKKKLRARA